MPDSRIYYVPMIQARCVAGIFRTMHRLVVLILLLLPLAAPAFAARWNSKAASDAFEKARKMKTDLARAENSTLGQYLECARIYRSVHISDPHFGRAGNAIYEEGLVYQEAADRFSKPEYYKTAVERFLLLLRDYSGNPDCPNALIQLGALYSQHLNDEQAAENAYKRLHSQYGYSEKAVGKLRAALVPNSPGSPLPAPAAPVAASPAGSKPVETPSTSPANVRNIRFWTTADYTRIIIDLDAEARYKSKNISDPDRIYFDIANARLDPSLRNRSFAVKDDLLKQIRVAQNQSLTVRVVLDTAGTSGTSVSEMHDPFRIVIDLRPKGKAAQPPSQEVAAAVAPAPTSLTPRKQPPPAAVTPSPLPETGSTKKSEQPATSPVKEVASEINPPPTAKKPLAATEMTNRTSEEAVKPAKPTDHPEATTAAPKKEAAPSPSANRIPSAPKSATLPVPQQALPTSRGDRTLTRTLGLKVARIVIDPGHGGHDNGSVGPGGFKEKDLVLSIALSLRDMIEQKLGAEVVLTREDDRFIPLEERTAVANEHKADLFISIHANSSRIRSTSGVETYYLDFAKTDAEREIAARENAMTDNNVRDLEDLIKKIAKADKSVESRELATIVQKNMYSGTRKVLPRTKNRGVRSAPFIVLIGANMPSVLAEVAFISNPKDERLLKKEATQQSLVKALFAGIDGYMKTLGNDMVLNQTKYSK
jgi:N-acetylmuramoyl-L-alanine amidase